MSNTVEHIFICLLAISVSSSVQCFFASCLYFLIVLLLWSFEIPLYILYINIFSLWSVLWRTLCFKFDETQFIYLRVLLKDTLSICKNRDYFEETYQNDEKFAFSRGMDSLQFYLFIKVKHTFNATVYCFPPNFIFAMKLILSVTVLPTLVFLKIWLGISALRFPQS